MRSLREICEKSGEVQPQLVDQLSYEAQRHKEVSYGINASGTPSPTTLWGRARHVSFTGTEFSKS
jgi:hypothetical protein